MSRRTILLVLLGIAIGIQFIPVQKNNPAVSGEIRVPPNVRLILERSCYDCHSNETEWPWYSKVAPVSWLVAHDVEEGREHLNLSEWGSHTATRQRELRQEIWEEVEEGEMPRWFYIPLHPEAGLTDTDKEQLRLWAHQDGPGAVALAE